MIIFLGFIIISAWSHINYSQALEILKRNKISPYVDPVSIHITIKHISNSEEFSLKEKEICKEWIVSDKKMKKYLKYLLIVLIVYIVTVIFYIVFLQ